MGRQSLDDMDFDAWVSHATADPDSFEALRRAAIEEVIAAAPLHTQARLRRLQWRIDQERRLAKTPMGACVRLSRMMWQSVSGPTGLEARLKQLQQSLAGEQSSTPVQPRSASILAFARD